MHDAHGCRDHKPLSFEHSPVLHGQFIMEIIVSGMSNLLSSQPFKQDGHDRIISTHNLELISCDSQRQRMTTSINFLENVQVCTSGRSIRLSRYIFLPCLYLRFMLNLATSKASVKRFRGNVYHRLMCAVS